MENYSKKKKLFTLRASIPVGVVFLSVLALAVGILWPRQSDRKNISNKAEAVPDYAYAKEDIKTASVGDGVDMEARDDSKKYFTPGPISMELIKNNGCVADGLLSGYGDKTEEIVKTINRSKCVYLHRSLETWLKPPDFSKAFDIMEKVEKRPVVYGMFLAEAIPTQRTYYDPAEDKRFHYEDMCREGTKGRWGNNTCITSIQNVEYRRYLKAVMRRAMDIGIQSFLFGQMQLQDEHPNFETSEIKDVIADMRQYSKERGMEIIIGAQTDDITDEKYLRLFDYVEGGVGIDSQGNVENQPCFSGHESCWALLWDKRYSAKANNVLLHLDWSGLTWDDMGVFARMSQEKRTETLANLYQKFTSQNMGFMMPYLAVLNHENNGCYGPSKDFYSPSKKYKCNDEKAISSIMANVTP